MTSSIFQQYEARKTRYNPGTIWEAYVPCVVERLEIVNPSNYSKYSFIDYHSQWELQYLNGENTTYVHTKVLVSDEFIFDFSKIGALVTWTKTYLESHYKPVL